MPDEPAPRRVLTNLSDREREFVEAARHGEEMVCSRLDVEELAVTEDPAHIIRAELIRELLIGRRGGLDRGLFGLTGARIVGEIDIAGNTAVAGLLLHNCTIDAPFRASYAKIPLLDITGCRIGNLIADSLRVDQDLVLAGLTIADQAGELAIFSLANAHVSGSFAMTHIKVDDTDIPLFFYGDRLYVDGDVLWQNLQIFVACKQGAIHLDDARLGSFDMLGVDIANSVGSALVANRARIDGDLSLTADVTLTGNNPLQIAGTRIDGTLNFGSINVVIDAKSGSTLNLNEVTIRNTLSLPPDLICADQGVTDICNHPQIIEPVHLTYAALSARLHWRQWLHVIRCHTPGYHASAYQQLAAVERAAGHDGNVRQILIAQQQDLRRRAPDALGGPLTRLFHWTWGVLAGYGYRARRTAAALLLTLALAGALGWWAGQVLTRPGHHSAERVASPTIQAGTPCSTIELIGLGLDRGLPLGLTGLRARCDLDTTSRKGQAFTVAIWGVQLAVWGLATLALAGYTNLVRKTN